MREEEFPAYVERAIADYADDMIRNGDMLPDAARTKAEADIARLLPDGLGSEAELRVIEDEDGRYVGDLVYAEHDREGRRFAFLYDIAVGEAHRGRGVGREAMQLLEAEVRGRGLDRIQLNVFGRNDVARRLYLSLGYAELSVQMAKDLG
jgi:GNAT superfamily N-acetyltransferase